MEKGRHHIAPYIGETKNGRLNGKGAYYFDSETKYVGGFKDGLFHGKGVLYMNNGARYEGEWENGKELYGVYYYSDGMAYKSGHFDYCIGNDRRFYQEHINGLRPATLSLMSASCDLQTGKPSQTIPDECYDAGDGVYNPNERAIYYYSEDYDESKFGKFRRHVTEDEHAWIVEFCRKGWDEVVGYDHPRFTGQSTNSVESLQSAPPDAIKQKAKVKFTD